MVICFIGVFLCEAGYGPSDSVFRGMVGMKPSLYSVVMIRILVGFFLFLFYLVKNVSLFCL